MFDAADDPVVAEFPPATLHWKSGPHMIILVQLWPIATGLILPLFPVDLQLFESVQQLIDVGQDKSCWTEQSALLFCSPTESHAPFRQYRLSSNHIHSLDSQFTNIGR